MSSARHRSRGFSLLETVIAIGVLAVLLGAFLVVFGPATASIRRAISTQEADRLATTFVSELTTLRDGQSIGGQPYSENTSPPQFAPFDKAFHWLKDSVASDQVLFVYQYRADPSEVLRPDGTMKPFKGADGEAGKNFVVQTVMRQRDDRFFTENEDLSALEGRVFVVKPTQLIYDQGSLKPGTAGQIVDPQTGAPVSDSKSYPGAMISFAAEFYDVPSTAPAYLKSGGAFDLTKLKSPLFTRNLAVNR